jgi:hypothetical protein
VEFTGVDGLTMNLKRQHDGLHVFVKAHADIESFFREASGNEQYNVAEGGRDWLSDEILRVYSIRGGFSSPTYDLFKVGRNIINMDSDSGQWKPNLSFLRLVGISRDAGVSFRIPGVYSKDQLLTVSDTTKRALRQFYADYMRTLEVFIRLVQTGG